MKRLIIVLFIAAISFAPQLNSAKAAAPPPQPNITFQVFYDQLSPYGTWVNNSSYGYVWVPSMGSGFVPYCSGGHWEYSDDFGWLWVSDYAWGWAPFHYGNWFYDDIYGWMWAPGYNWASAWVTWGSYDGYYGWAPIGPGYTFASAYRPPARYWNFVPYGHIYERNIYNYRSRNNVVINNVTVINNTKVYNNQTYYSGPRREDVEKNSGHRIATVAVAETDKPGATRVENNRVTVYRPAVNKEPAGARVAPAKVGTRESLKPVGTNSPNAPQRGAVNRTSTPATQPGNAGEKISNDRGGNAIPRKSEPVKQGVQRQAPTERGIPAQQQPKINPAQKVGSEKQMERTAPVRQPQKINQQPAKQAPQRNVTPQQPQSQPRGVQPQPQMHQAPVRQQTPQPQMHQEPIRQQQPQMQPRQQAPPQGGGGEPRQAAPQRGGPRR